MRGVEDTGPFPGRHASRTEIAAETPIFHALTVGGWRSRQHEPSAREGRRENPRPPRRSAEALDEFRRDPLTAPIPVQAYSSLTPALTPAPALPASAQAAPQATPAAASRTTPEYSGGPSHAPLYAAHVPAYAPAAPAYTSLTDTGPQALGELSSHQGRHHRRAVGSGSGHHHLSF
ncbi:hypothetical protein GCM10023175_16120 [Pseudonocardia xishanensis]|uniref:Uncharacterized protein n=1 Tax=Pseudonocardia xishanensis TaxID=630995 RepID=A0ABP8RLY7_9PSEU